MSYGLGVRAQVTDYLTLALGGAFGEEKKGFLGRAPMEYRTRWWAGPPVPQVVSFFYSDPPNLGLVLLCLVMTEARQDYSESPPIPYFSILGVDIGEIIGDNFDFVGSQSRGPAGDYYIGLGVTLFAVGFDFAFNPVEFVDFLLGWFTIDICDDD